MAYDSRESLMATPLDQFEEPKTAPDGHYYGQIIRHPDWRTQEGTKNGDIDILYYPIQLMEPAEDVDQTELDGIDLRAIELPYEFWIWNKTKQEASKNSMFSLRKFHASLGFDETLPAEQSLHETVGLRVLVNIGHRTYKDRRTGEDRRANQIIDAVGVGN